REAPRAGVFGELPIPLDPIVGRHAELARLGELRRTARLITLRGPAGTGKSRLAREVAAAPPGGARRVDGCRLAAPARLRAAAGWTATRSPSSWPPGGRVTCPSRMSGPGWTTRSRC